MKFLSGLLSGRKTYGLAVVLFLLAMVDIGGGLPADQKAAIYATAVAGLVAALRLAIAKLPAEAQEKLERAKELLESIGKQLPQPVDTAAMRSTYPPPLGVNARRGLSRAGLLLLCCLIPAMAFAGDVRIVGPVAVPAAGYPCELFVQGDLPDGTKFAWDHTPKTEGVSLVDSADRYKPVVRLNTMAGQYKLIVSVTPPGDAPPVLLYHDFTVPGSPYTPPAPPAPKPVNPVTPEPVKPVDPVTPQPVEPVFDAGQFQMAELTYRAAMAVKSANRKAEALCLAAKIAALVADIKSGAVSSPQAVVNAIAAAFDGCLSGEWDAARDKLTDRVASLLAGRQLTQMQHWQTLASEALAGLNEAAKR